MPYLPHIQKNNGSCAFDSLLCHPRKEGGEGGLIPFYDAAGAEEAHDTRGDGEGAEHDRDAAVLVDM